MEKNSVLSICCAPNVQYITLKIVKKIYLKMMKTMQLITHSSSGGATGVVEIAVRVVAAVVMVIVVTLSATQLLVG